MESTTKLATLKVGDTAYVRLSGVLASRPGKLRRVTVMKVTTTLIRTGSYDDKFDRETGQSIPYSRLNQLLVPTPELDAEYAQQEEAAKHKADEARRKADDRERRTEAAIDWLSSQSKETIAHFLKAYASMEALEYYERCNDD